VHEQPQGRPAPAQPTQGGLPPSEGPSGRTDSQASPRGGWRRRPDAWQRGGPLRRQQEGRLIGGVAAGISARTCVGVNLIRAAFVFSSLLSGFGVAVYVLAWLFVPAAGEDGSIASRAMADRRGIALAAAAASLLALILFFASLLKVGWLGSLSWPPVIALAGLVLIWRNASPEEQAVIHSLADPALGGPPGPPGSRRRSGLRRLRVILAVVLLITGVGVLVSGHIQLALLRPLSGVLAVIAAIVLLLGPWWLRIARDLLAERQARIRAEERAEMASRVHDSVLQTLALIQRRAGDPHQVVSLARAQERELRSWLFDGRAPGSLDGRAASIADGVRLIQQETEAQHGIVVEAISVGDCPLDDDLSALLAAAREATVNAAKWSGAGTVSLFAEVEPDAVSVFVRDRGRGFDPAAVPQDRKGLAESVRARMERRGGSATVRSTPGEGTEVVLTMPRTASHREPSTSDTAT
jgi:signal transduction histidine kinase